MRVGRKTLNGLFEIAFFDLFRNQVIRFARGRCLFPEGLGLRLSGRIDAAKANGKGIVGKGYFPKFFGSRLWFPISLIAFL
jgi:hypothetical protein